MVPMLQLPLVENRCLTLKKENKFKLTCFQLLITRRDQSMESKINKNRWQSIAVSITVINGLISKMDAQSMGKNFVFFFIRIGYHRLSLIYIFLER